MRQVQEIEQAVGQEKNSLCKEYRINRDTILNAVEHFSPVTNIPPDVMHNILEGVIPRTTQFYLRKICVEEGLITIADLNDKIQSFDYGYTELINKPSLIKLQHLTGNFHQSAAQAWLLAVTLPIILN